jgi:phosphoribosylanthranilate isomerase
LGGNGVTFDWEILKNYDNEIPFFLSGGIDIQHIEEISRLKNLNIHALDINSKFELSAGLKDVEKIKKFTELLGGE